MPPYVNPNKKWQESPNTDAITSASMAPTPQVTYSAPTPTPIYPVPTLGQPQLMEMTGLEKTAQTETTGLSALYAELNGESAARASEEKTRGVEGLNQTVNDLSTRLTGLKNEALAIPLQLQNDVVKNGAIVTAGGLQPHQTAALRNNAIQALSTNSLLEAARGNLTTAMDMADRAVKQRFDPVREQIAAKTKNLELIMNSPQYSLEQKNRAAAQLQQQEDRKRALDNQEDDNKTAQAMAAAATKNFPNDAGAQMAINQALALDPSDPDYLPKIYSLMGKYQTDPNETAAALADLEYKRQQTLASKESLKIDWARYGLDAEKIAADIALTKAQTNKVNTEAANPTAKAATGAEKTVLGYYLRGKDALETIAPLEEGIASKSLKDQAVLQFAPNFLQSSNNQIYRQAQRQFTEARLRKESGAAIPTGEYESDSKTYFAQPGDTKEVLLRKQAARSAVLNSLGVSSGNAYAEYFGERYPTAFGGQASAPTQTSAPAKQVIYNGKKYNVDAQGNMTEA
ncbi:hypothetical protein [Bradyrhizobium sp. AUGA SZCCT0431]|uniref:hypothetical protein n=1 Tax=Bradyrhizobium sp. AUGA SZCCT0431 TaxID=2807674 RepID=UPI001BACF5BC|nr:hypothetical protein [Bradyrhizobium sp. AUGA SZCCT0431]MBR1146673.1 hypothetical protein [Bradyrhizobium sp. AUGA SZCCT0431]